ncbi:MAG: glycosyltransferase [Bacteroidia bacterium]|nr:glycosyltransferase [Bacteroidia bacterium]
MIILQIFIACCVLHFFIQLVTGAGIIAAFHPDKPLPHQPMVSILLAVRNEEQNIESCLHFIDRLNYPKEKLQVLIGNDRSEDQTEKLVNDFIIHKPYMQLISITDTKGKAQGKANVLAQLAHHATGEFFFITDADIRLNANWINSLLAEFETDTGIVSGTTLANGTTWFERMQAIDWTYFSGMLVGITTAGLPCTAVGNNMAVKREAYFSTGGYEALDFSVTEDYKLYEEVRKKGWLTKNIFTPGSCTFTQTLDSFKAILHQRKRWLTGGRALPMHWKLILGIYGLFSPLFIMALFISPVTALTLMGIKMILELIITNIILTLAGMRPSFISHIWHQFYTLMLNLSLSIFYYLPLPFNWKNRNYQQ